LRANCVCTKLAIYGVIFKVITTESDMQNCWKCTLVCDFTYVKVNKSVNISLLLCLALF